ncbi:hypothetical protein BV898_15327 [Hypsibius exemplaris]|uniref:non-specific serine/threonine protein kinase n=1 Tax=Hypsibius exemplaris TaxID=2072580 RepID=A0A9X6NDP4_HYPEX|nr:hypothetical protein BV898_15327 [Hypsibius exemplaris]
MYQRAFQSQTRTLTPVEGDLSPVIYYQLGQLNEKSTESVVKCRDEIFSLKYIHRPPEQIGEIIEIYSQLRKLDHSNIVKYFNYGWSQEPAFPKPVTFASMQQYMSGGNFKTLSRQFMTGIDVITLASQIADGLAYLHSRKPIIAHGNLRSDCIFITDGGSKILLGDLDNFISVDAIVPSSQRTFYMPPEQLKKNYKGHMTYSDIWSMGCVILHMLGGGEFFIMAEGELVRCMNDDQGNELIIQKICAGGRPHVPTSLQLPANSRDALEECFRITPSARMSAENVSRRLKCHQNQTAPEPRPDEKEFMSSTGITIRVKLERYLDSGRFGQVFLARIIASEQLEIQDHNIILKSMQTNQPADKTTIQLWNILRQLTHPNIVRYYAFGDNETNWLFGPLRTVFSIQEYLSGGTLAKHCKEFPSMNRLRMYTGQILQGLAYLHSRSPPIIHGDIKGDNIVLTADKQIAKICDLDDAICTCRRKWHSQDGQKMTDEVGMSLDVPLTSGASDLREARPTDLIQLFSGGARPFIPPNAAPDLYNFLSQCFQIDNRERPSATKAVLFSSNAMDLFLSPFLGPLMQTGVASVYTACAKAASDLLTDPKNRERNHERIENYFETKDILPAIEKMVRTLSENGQRSAVSSKVYDGLNEINNNLSSFRTLMKDYGRSPGPKTWKVVDGVYCNGLIPGDKIRMLFEWITVGHVGTGKLLDNIRYICQDDVELYKEHDRILVAMLNGLCDMQILFERYDNFPIHNALGRIDAPFTNQLLPEHVGFAMTERNSHISRITRERDISYQKMKTHFIRKNCSDPRHAANNASPCNTLDHDLYKCLSDYKRSANHVTADRIVSDVLAKYGHFSWSVLVVKKRADVKDFLYNEKCGTNIYLKRFGRTRRLGPRREPWGRVDPKGDDELAPYGCLIGYRTGFFSEKAAVLFWVDRDIIGDTSYITCDHIRNVHQKCLSERKHMRGDCGNTLSEHDSTVTGDRNQFLFSFLMKGDLCDKKVVTVKDASPSHRITKSDEWCSHPWTLVGSSWESIDAVAPPTEELRLDNLLAFFDKLLLAATDPRDEQLQLPESKLSGLTIQPFRQLQTVLQWISQAQYKFDVLKKLRGAQAWKEFVGTFDAVEYQAAKPDPFTDTEGGSIVREDFVECLKLIAGMDPKTMDQLRIVVANAIRRAAILQVLRFIAAVDAGDSEAAAQTALLVRASQLNQVLEPKYVEQARFLFGKSGHSKHRHCGAEDEAGCSELSALLYEIIHSNSSCALPLLAGIAGRAVRDSYPRFVWSVTALDSPLSVELQANPKYAGDMWMQKFGLHRTGTLKKVSKRENKIISGGVGNYGCFLCYRSSNGAQRGLLVCWADRTAVEESRGAVEIMREQRDRLHGSVTSLRKSDMLEKLSRIYRLTERIGELKLSFVFAVGLEGDASDDREPGDIYPEVLGEGHWPIYIWPQQITTQRFRLAEGEGVPINNSLVADIQLLKFEAPVQGHFVGEFVAVKRIALQPEEAMQRKEISALESSLGSRKMIIHPNVVRCFAMQLNSPENLWQKPTFDVITEWCSGGSLSDLVQERALVLEETLLVGRQLLQGIAFLHLHGVARLWLQGEHVLFGRRNDLRDVKINIMANVDQVMQRAQRSFVATDPHHKMWLYQPPSTDERKGSKTDIWSFGCLLILMATREDPIWHGSSINVDKPIPATLKCILNATLSNSYSNRPSAQELLASPTFA